MLCLFVQRFIASRTPFSGMIALLFVFLAGASASTASPGAPVPSAPCREDQILIKPKPGVDPVTLANFHSARHGKVLHTFERLGRVQIVRLPEGETVPGFIAEYRQGGLVEFAEPDYLVHASLTPNDPAYLDGTLWYLNNFGQSGGTPDADIDAPEAWDLLTSASNIVVAVLDTGILYTHEDLAANMWVNPSDGSHGFNAINGTNDPYDDNGHGTLVSGVMGAVGNNGKGLVGVAWQVQLMGCKSLDSTGNGSDSTLIAGIDFAITNGARIINASLDSPGTSLAVSNAIASARDAGIIFVASCGNGPTDVDVSPRYPACYDLDNIISVAYTTRNDTLGTYSNFGATNVDLAAPGADMYSTFGPYNNSYLGGSFLEGTSLAAPCVAGACALVLARYPGENYRLTIGRVLAGVDPLPALAGKCVTGGRLNLRKALSPPIRLIPLPTAGQGLFSLRVSTGPNRHCVVEISTNLANWSPAFTNTTSTNGTFDFVDPNSVNAAQRFYRVVAAP